MKEFIGGVFKTIKEQSPYYNMTFAILLLFILLFPVFMEQETLDKIPEIVGLRQKCLLYIVLLFILFFVFGVGQTLKRLIEGYTRKKKALEERRKKQVLLSKLEVQFAHPGLVDGFKSQDECIQWANITAPLLKFNDQYYSTFIADSYGINTKGLSGISANTFLNRLKSQLEMAIEELKYDLNK